MSLTDEIIRLLAEQNIKESDLPTILQNLKNTNPNRFKPANINFNGSRVRFGYFTDAHMGHIDYRPDVLETASKYWHKEGVEFIINAGDTIEGMSGRDGHIYELTHIGASAQLAYFEQEISKLADWVVYSIEADSSHGGWFKSKGNAGLDIGPELERRSSNYRFIGYDEQDIVLDNGLKIRLRHPGGGVAYAISYKMQKYIESISGGHKPEMVFQGHFHKYNKIFYRNVFGLDAGCVCNQTPWMKKKGTPAHVGFGLVDVTFTKRSGVKRFIETFVPFYD